MGTMPVVGWRPTKMERLLRLAADTCPRVTLSGATYDTEEALQRRGN